MKYKVYFSSLLIIVCLFNLYAVASPYLAPIGLDKSNTFSDMTRDEKLYFLNSKFGEWSDTVSKALAQKYIDELKDTLDPVLSIQINVQVGSNPDIMSLESIDLGQMLIYRNSLMDKLREVIESDSSENSIEAFVKRVHADFPVVGFDQYRWNYERPVDLALWLDELNTLLDSYYLLVQWDLLNRFSKSDSIELWRGFQINPNYKQLHPDINLKSPEKFVFDANFFSHRASYAANFSRYIMITDVPFESIRQTSWLNGVSEIEVVVTGPALVKKIYNRDDKSRQEEIHTLVTKHDQEMMVDYPQTFQDSDVIEYFVGRRLKAMGLTAISS